jgi:hypothetical protein
MVDILMAADLTIAYIRTESYILYLAANTLQYQRPLSVGHVPIFVSQDSLLDLVVLAERRH